MIKKIVLIIIGAALLVLLGLIIYFREFQNLPEFALSLLSPMPAPTANENILVFAPHSDDEVLATGGYISLAIKSQANVTVVLATNGDGHRFSSMEEYKEIYPDSADYIQSGYDRQQETINGLAVLGVKKENIIFMGYPDGGLQNLLNGNYQTPYTSPYTKKQNTPYTNSYQSNVAYTGENLTNNLTSIINEKNPDVILVSSPNDLHPDHAALAVFLDRALNRITLKPQVYNYLVHARGFPYPKGLHPNRFLSPPARFVSDDDTWFNYNLSADVLNQKQTAVEQYHSQLKVPLLHSLMDSFIRQNEIFFKVNR